MPRSDRLPVVASLLLGVAIVGVLFARRVRPEATGSDDPAAAAARAHEAAGVEVGAVGPVAPAFQARLDSARSRLDEAPDDPDRLLALARLLHDGHRPGEAEPLYRRVLDADPDHAEAAYDLAAALSALGDQAGASEVLEGRLERHPDDAVALYDLGALRANAGDRPGAVEWFRRAVAAAGADTALASRARDALVRLGGGG